MNVHLKSNLCSICDYHLKPTVTKGNIKDGNVQDYKVLITFVGLYTFFSPQIPFFSIKFFLNSTLSIFIFLDSILMVKLKFIN